MIFHYRCPFCCEPYRETACGPRHREVFCKFHKLGTIKMTPDGITYDRVVRVQHPTKTSGEREPSRDGKTGER